mmetsp:Transcript_19117/g.27710  ORF Transcript_19117/g.27710 Transcript_19117/m.27710 type:complete len:167 (+) Transcript_19117:841-1341(+)
MGKLAEGDEGANDALRIHWYGDSIGMEFTMITEAKVPPIHRGDPIKTGLEAGLGGNKLHFCHPACTINQDDPSLPHFSKNPADFNCAKEMDKRLVQGRPNYAILQQGTNDLRAYHRQSVKDVEKAMARLIDQAKQVCMPIVVAPPLMSFSEGLRSDFLEPYYTQFL